MNHTWKQILLLIGLTMSAAISNSAQTTEPRTPDAAARPQAAGGDPISQLNLTADQRDRIRQIREQNREERAAVSQRLRETNRALQEVLENDNPDDSLVEQRLKEVAAAQAEATRMRILSEIKIRRVLTQEQRVLLKTLRSEANARREGRRLENIEDRQQRLEMRSQRMHERRRLRGPANKRPQPPIL